MGEVEENYSLSFTDQNSTPPGIISLTLTGGMYEGMP